MATRRCKPLPSRHFTQEQLRLLQAHCWQDCRIETCPLTSTAMQGPPTSSSTMLLNSPGGTTPLYTCVTQHITPGNESHWHELYSAKGQPQNLQAFTRLVQGRLVSSP